MIGHLQNVASGETVLYTKRGANIENRSPEHLTDLALSSARRQAGARRMDGITYLISVKKQNIGTPLMSDYEAAILRKTRAKGLDQAHNRIRREEA